MNKTGMRQPRMETPHRCRAVSNMIYRNWPALASRAVRNLIGALILIIAVFGFAFAAGLPSEPHTLSDFEDVWDYVVLNDVECMEFHYDEKQSVTGLCHTAYCALVNGYAVCDGYTSLLNMLLRMDGIECIGREGTTAGGLHEWAYAKLDGEWVNIDATWYDGGCPAYMEMTDEEIARTHTVDLSYQELAAKEALQEKLRQAQNPGVPALSNAYDSKQYEIPHYT